MEVSIYPGCSLEGLAKSYMESVEAVSKTLGIELRELANWTCCGSASAHVMNDDLAVALAARNLGIAEKAGMDLVVPCAACYQRLKVAEKHLKQGKPVEGLPV
ncbi:MAG: disulfide reductase, partial [Dehalococcoidia bacterium]